MASTLPAVGYWLAEAGGELQLINFRRRAPRPTDIVIDIHYCGICHSDMVWLNTQKKPVMPGHEIAGVVAQVGSEVGDKFQVGDHAGVGFFVDSCKTCRCCRRGQNNYCAKGVVNTMSTDPASLGYVESPADFQPGAHGGHTLGGFSTCIVVDCSCAVKIPKSMDLARAAPLFCSGGTVFAPLSQNNVGPGTRVGVMGLGGLGHIAVKMAKAMGAHVTVLSSSNRKRQYALEELGADSYLVSSDEDALKAASRSIDVVIDTVGEPHQPSDFFEVLEVGATWCAVGVIFEPYQVKSFALIMKNLKLSGSFVSSSEESQAMIELCAANGIAPDVEVVPFESVNDTLRKLESGQLPLGKSRFVLDIVGFRNRAPACEANKLD